MSQAPSERPVRWGTTRRLCCEVYPEKSRIRVQAYERSRKMPLCGPEIRLVQPSENWSLEGTSAQTFILPCLASQPTRMGNLTLYHSCDNINGIGKAAHGKQE
jgi:hypothetical protein